MEGEAATPAAANGSPGASTPAASRATDTYGGGVAGVRVKTVTRANWVESLTELRAALNRACFVAVDGEFSGLHTNDSACRELPMEPMGIRYNKLRAQIESFRLLQFGVCVFERRGEESHDGAVPALSARAWSVYCAPGVQQRGPHRHDAFHAQWSSLRFLRSNGFSFDAWIENAIPCSRVADSVAAATLQSENVALMFGSVVAACSRQGVPVLVHNGLQDTAHFLHTFVQELPESLRGFKTLLHEKLPNLYDTKAVLSVDVDSHRDYRFRSLFIDRERNFICTNLQFALQVTLNPLQQPGQPGPTGVFPQVVCVGGEVRSSFHDAAADAFATGVVGLRVAAMIAMLKGRLGEEAAVVCAQSPQPLSSSCWSDVLALRDFTPWRGILPVAMSITHIHLCKHQACTDWTNCWHVSLCADGTGEQPKGSLHGVTTEKKKSLPLKSVRKMFGDTRGGVQQAFTIGSTAEAVVVMDGDASVPTQGVRRLPGKGLSVVVQSFKKVMEEQHGQRAGLIDGVMLGAPSAAMEEDCGEPVTVSVSAEPQVSEHHPGSKRPRSPS